MNWTSGFNKFLALTAAVLLFCACEGTKTEETCVENPSTCGATNVDANSSTQVDAAVGLPANTDEQKRCTKPCNAHQWCDEKTGTCKCKQAFRDCDGNFSNGCETRVNTADNCNRCGVTCNYPKGCFCLGSDISWACGCRIDGRI